MRLKDKVCLITGAAGGMGLEAARLFAREGARVVRMDLNDGPEVPGTAFVKGDVSRDGDCKAAVDFAVQKFGGLDALYNNAGIFPADDGGATETPESTWERVMDVNRDDGRLRTCLPAVDFPGVGWPEWRAVSG